MIGDAVARMKYVKEVCRILVTSLGNRGEGCSWLRHRATIKLEVLRSITGTVLGDFQVT